MPVINKREMPADKSILTASKVKPVKKRTGLRMRKGWMLGFLGFLGVPGIFSHNKLDILWMLWFAFFLYFIPKK